MNVLLLDSQLCFSLYAATRAMTAVYGPLLAPLGLTYPQYLAMLVLWEGDALSVKALGERLQLDSGTLTPLLKKLEKQGLVVRARDDVDGRVLRVRLTGAGKALRKKAVAVPKGLLCATGLELQGLVRLRNELSALTQTLRAANAQAHSQQESLK